MISEQGLKTQPVTHTFQVIDLLCKDFELFLQLADSLILFLQLLHEILSPERQDIIIIIIIIIIRQL